MEKLFVKSYSEKNILTNSSSDIFIKTKNLETNIIGKSPLLIYQKPIKLINYNFLNKNTDFITDGGLSKKNLILKPKMKRTILKNNQNNNINNQTFSNSVKNIFKNNYSYINNRNIKIINNKNFKKNKTYREKIKKKENKIQDDFIENDDTKINNINKLIENGIKRILNDFYSNNNKTNKFIENKQKVIKDNGIIIKTQTLDSIETDNNISKSNNFSINNNSLYKLKKNYIHNYINNDISNKEEKKIKNKRTLKPSIDQFEYLNKISQEQIKIYGHSFTIRNNSHNRVFSNLMNKKKDDKNKFININTNNTFILQNGNNNITFRKGKSSSNLCEYKKKFPHKYTCKELYLFLKEKKLKKRKKIEKEENEKSKNFFRIFNNLFNLCIKDIEDSSKLNNEKTNKTNLSKENYKNYLKKFNQTIIRNNYLDLYSFKTESTIVEPTNYLCKIFECQKILNNDIESKQINNNIYKEILNNNNNDNNISFDIEKVNETLNKTNLIINGKQIKNLINNEKIINKDIISNNNIKENNENKNNIDVNLNYNNQIKSSSNSNSNEYIINNTIVSSKKNVSIEIDYSKLIKILIKTIKLIYKRKIFYILYKIYLFETILERYNIAISFFIAILKIYPFKKIMEKSKI